MSGPRTQARQRPLELLDRTIKHNKDARRIFTEWSRELRKRGLAERVASDAALLLMLDAIQSGRELRAARRAFQSFANQEPNPS